MGTRKIRDGKKAQSTPKRKRGAARGKKTAEAGRIKRVPTTFGTGFDDNLEPTVAIDLSRVQSVSDLVEQYGRTAIGARQVGTAADILTTMTEDRDCYVVLTISGAMTVAKMGLVVCDMIEKGMVHAIVATGALMAHGFVEASGLLHFKYDPAMDDVGLFDRGYNRVYDSLELERNLDDVEQVMQIVLEDKDDGKSWSSMRLHRELGAYMSRQSTDRGILRSAYEHDVPIFVPAFTDSELGLDFALHNRRRAGRGQPRLVFDPFEDLEDYTQRIGKQKRLGIFTIGGGVPRNWAQQVGPYLDLLNKRASLGRGMMRFQYGVRICPEPVHWGGLSGCTYSEGVSWGKFLPTAEGGRFAEVYADATIAWPLVVKAVMERLEGKRRKGRSPRPKGAAPGKRGARR